MRRPIAWLVAAALAGSPAWSAQAADEPVSGAKVDAARIDALRADVRRDRAGVVSRNLSLSPEQEKRFAPVYAKCSAELEAARRQVNRLVVDYVNAEGSVSDAYAQALATDLLRAEQAEVNARNACFKRVQKVLPGRKAARYLQIETKLLALDRFDVAAAIPLLK